MKKSEIFNLLLDKVADVCEVKRESIISGIKLQAVVDARILLVQYLRRIGLSSDDIALVSLKLQGKEPNDIKEIKQKAKTVDRLFNAYSSRCLQSYSFCLMSQDISKWCRGEYQTIYIEHHDMKQLPK